MSEPNWCFLHYLSLSISSPSLSFRAFFVWSWIAVFIVEGDKSIMGHHQAAHTGRRLEKATCFSPCRGECGICAVSHSYFKIKHYSVVLGGIKGSTSCDKDMLCFWMWLNRDTFRDISAFTISSNPNKIIREDQFTYFPTLIILQPRNETLCNDFNSLAFILDSYSSMTMRKFKKLVYLLHLIFCESALCWFDHNGCERTPDLNTSM